jgi:tripartite-type tricarboxylate transporter receptor subunit TctC
MRISPAGFFCGALVALSAVTSAVADEVADFYHGKVLNIYVAGSIGGPSDIRARALEPYFRKYIPGTPNIVVQILPGAGGNRATNNLYNLMPKDGTALGLLLPTLAFNQAIGMQGIQYDSRKFRYIGSLDPFGQAVVVSKTVPIRTIADAKKTEVALGSSGRGSSSWIVPAMMNRFMGTKFRIISGYTGMSDILLGIDRGELGGIAINWYSIATSRPQWQPGRDVFAVAQSGLTRIPAMPDVPTRCNGSFSRFMRYRRRLAWCSSRRPMYRRTGSRRCAWPWTRRSPIRTF